VAEDRLYRIHQHIAEQRLFEVGWSAAGASVHDSIITAIGKRLSRKAISGRGLRYDPSALTCAIVNGVG
jgi:hypothetical protein